MGVYNTLNTDASVFDNGFEERFDIFEIKLSKEAR